MRFWGIGEKAGQVRRPGYENRGGVVNNLSLYSGK
jgi:hypothetical protein